MSTQSVRRPWRNLEKTIASSIVKKDCYLVMPTEDQAPPPKAVAPGAELRAAAMATTTRTSSSSSSPHVGSRLGASHIGGFTEWASSSAPVVKGMQASTTPEGRLLEVKKRFAKFFGSGASGASASGGDHGHSGGGGSESRGGESPNQRHSESNDQLGDDNNTFAKAAASLSSPSASSSYLDPVGARARDHGQAYGMVSP